MSASVRNVTDADDVDADMEREHREWHQPDGTVNLNWKAFTNERSMTIAVSVKLKQLLTFILKKFGGETALT